MQNFIRFVKHIWASITLVREVMVCLLVLICIGGVLIFYLEDDIALFDALYFAFITGLAIGYGDITPETTLGRIVAIAIGVVGLVFIGLIVAIATYALEESARERLKLTRRAARADEETSEEV